MEKTEQEMTNDSPSTAAPNTAQRILFADDDATVGWLVSRYLEGMGHQVQVVDNGQKAVEAVKNGVFDVVLLDLWMPTMDGAETAAEIRAYAESTGQRFPIIAATSHRVEKLDRCWDEGLFDAVLSKPVKGEELAQVISAWSN